MLRRFLLNLFQAFMDPKLDGFFDQLNSFHLLLNLLFVNKRYDDVLEVFEIIKNKQIQGAKYPKNAVVLVLATCYKQVSSFRHNFILYVVVRGNNFSRSR